MTDNISIVQKFSLISLDYLERMGNEKMSDNEANYSCQPCDYQCRYNSNFVTHLMTTKHKKVKNGKKQIMEIFDCVCGKKYIHQSGLCRHKKVCKHQKKLVMCEDVSRGQMYDNSEFKTLLLEQQKEIKKLTEHISTISTAIKNTTNNTTNNRNTTNNNNNTTNNKFNLNFFLNTQCKDAMSIQSFMENLSIGSKELEHMGDVGFLNGMIDIFNNTIGNMDIHKRPLHCTDAKREVLYFKQGDEWEKDSTDKHQLKKLIKDVETKNYYNLQDWSRDHKESFTSETVAGDQYVKIATEALGGADSTKDTIYLSKIMKHIIREVTVKA